MPSAARKLEHDPSPLAGSRAGINVPDAAGQAVEALDDPAVASLPAHGPTVLTDPRLVHGGVAQGVRLLRRLQRTQGNAAVVRAMSARSRPGARGGGPSTTRAGGTAGMVARPSIVTTPAGVAASEGLSVQAAMIEIPPPPTRAPVEPPEDDPRFSRAIEKTRTTAHRERKHPPGRAKANEAAKAAVPPAGDAPSQAADAQVKKMDAQKPGEFNKKAFVDAVEKAVDAATPGSLKQATEFKESGKAGEIKGKVAGMVTQDKQRVEKGIKDKTKEPPDTSVAKIKPVTPLTPERPGALTPTIGAAAGMPPPRPASETDLRHGPAAVDNEMAEADVTEEQLRESNEPDFQQAVDAKKEAEAHSREAPAAYRAEEAGTLGTAKAAASRDEKTQLAGMHRGRIAGLGKITSSKSAAKLQDEAKRLEVATKVNTIFAKTKTDVTKILDGIEAKMAPIFDRGEKAARAKFEAHVSARMKAYKKKRYSGIRGKGRWIRDKFRSLPDVVNKFYVEGKTIYIDLMRTVIGNVADVVGGELKKAKARITQGRGEVKTYVDSLPKNLKKVGKSAASKMTAQFDSLESEVDAKQDELVNALAEKYTAARKELDERIVALQEENKGLIDKAIDFAKGVINTIRKLKDLLFDVLSRAISAIGKIIRHPIRFLGNLVGAVKSGIMLFKENIEEHLYKGLTGWLFGQLGKTGLEMPKSLDLKGILGLLLQVLGLTPANIRARAVDKLGEPVVLRMEQGVEVFKTLKEEGLGGLWKFISDKVGDLKEAIIAPMIDFVKNKIIVAGVMWLVSLLNPASAFIKAAKAIYEIVMFFVERASQLKELVDSILDSIEAIASGGAESVGKFIEKTLAKMVPVVVGFLAALLGVGGIGEKVRSVVEAIQKPVKIAIDFVLNGAIKLGKKLFGGAGALFAKGKAYVKGKAEAGKKWVAKKVEGGKKWVKTKVANLKGALLAMLGKSFSADGKPHELTVSPTGKILIASDTPRDGDAHTVGAQAAAQASGRPDMIDPIRDLGGLIRAHQARLAAVRAEEIRSLEPSDPKNARFLAVIDRIVATARAIWTAIHYSGVPGEATAQLPSGLGRVAPYGQQGRPPRAPGLLAEHVLPDAWVSDAFETVGLERLNDRQYSQMTTVLIYATAAGRKTNKAGSGDNTIIRDVLMGQANIGSAAGVMTNRVDTTMNAVVDDHAAERRTHEVLPTRDRVVESAGRQMEEIVRFARENAKATVRRGEDYEGSRRLINLATELISGADTNPAFRTQAANLVGRFSSWLTTNSSGAPARTRILVAEVRARLEQERARRGSGGS